MTIELTNNGMQGSFVNYYRGTQYVGVLLMMRIVEHLLGIELCFCGIQA